MGSNGELTLMVRGRVELAGPWSFERLASLPRQVDVAEVVPDKKGGAVRLRTLLGAAGVTPDAALVTLESADGTQVTVPLDEVGEGLVIYRDGDDPLPADLGGPIRFLLPEAPECAEGAEGEDEETTPKPSAEIVDKCANIKALSLIETARAPRVEEPVVE